MKTPGANFTLHGAPSGDAYGGSFEYTDPAPLAPQRNKIEFSKTPAVIDLSIFWLAVNILVASLIAFPLN